MDDQHKRLSDLMQARRLALGMKTWRALASEAGISYETLRALRSGENIAPGTAHAVEQTLQWASGSIEAVLDGGEPTPVVTGTMHATLPALQGGATGTAHQRSEARPISARQTPPADDTGEAYEGDETEPDLERAFELLAEAQQLLAKVRRERQKGA